MLLVLLLHLSTLYLSSLRSDLLLLGVEDKVLSHLSIKVMLLLLIGQQIRVGNLVTRLRGILESGFDLWLRNHSIALFFLDCLGIQVIEKIIRCYLCRALRHVIDVLGLESILVQCNLSHIGVVPSQEEFSVEDFLFTLDWILNRGPIKTGVLLQFFHSICVSKSI